MHLRYAPEEGLIIGQALRLEAGGAIGPAFGGDGGYAWSIRGGVTLEVVENVGINFGYRLLELNVEDDDWEFDGGLQGLFLGGTIRF
jgi:hypothetical protein